MNDQRKEQNRMLTIEEAASRLGLTPGTLANLRCQQRGPGYVRRGRTILYPESAIVRYDRERTFVFGGGR